MQVTGIFLYKGVSKKRWLHAPKQTIFMLECIVGNETQRRQRSHDGEFLHPSSPAMSQIVARQGYAPQLVCKHLADLPSYLEFTVPQLLFSPSLNDLHPTGKQRISFHKTANASTQMFQNWASRVTSPLFPFAAPYINCISTSSVLVNCSPFFTAINGCTLEEPHKVDVVGFYS